MAQSAHHHGQQGQTRPWKRVLYEKQPFRDNFYSAHSFFAHLRIQTHKLDYSRDNVIAVFTAASLVTQQFSAITSFFVNYRLQSLKLRTPHDLTVLNTSLVISGLILYYLLSDMPNKRTYLFEKLKVGLLFGACLRIAAPVLQTLTVSFSEDTVHALAITFSVLHLVYHDYRLGQDRERKAFSSAVSLNAAIFTAILLASRYV
jgi:hypothetical protein